MRLLAQEDESSSPSLAMDMQRLLTVLERIGMRHPRLGAMTAR